MKIYDSMYKDVPSVIVETDKLVAAFLPALGGKLTSLVDKKTGRELLEQAKGAEYQKLAYAGAYVPAECSAFDDMFPTIDAFRCNQFPWEGVEMPDHGEVCGLPWMEERSAESLKLTVHGVRFPYTMEKTIAEKNGNLAISYKVTNHSPFEFDFVYAAHCMIAAQENAEIIVPYPEGAQGTVIFHEQGKMKYNDKYTWKGLKMGGYPGGETFKFFFDEPIPEGWVQYKYTDGSYVKMTFDADKLPYFALWLNCGSFKGMYNCAFEPCSGTHDRPDVARMHKKFSVLPAYGTYEWNVGFEVE